MTLLKHNGYYDFILKYNYKLISTHVERKNKLNVNIYMLDALSRFRFAKQMLYSKKYLISISQKYQIYEMLKYHTLGINSPINYRALIQGGNSFSLFDIFKRNKYTTAALPGNYDPYLKFYGMRNKKYVDHNIQLFRNCSDSFLYGKYIRCLGNKQRHIYQLEYLESLYLHNHKYRIPVFSFTSFMESHDSSFLSIKRVDIDFAEHLATLEKRNILNTSITIIIGDHGMHYGKYSKTEIVPKWYRYMRKQLHNYLMHYQNEFITALEVHDLLINVAEHDNNTLKIKYNNSNNCLNHKVIGGCYCN